ncbi:hypothetical protein LSTR_LSTR003786 [Laodelphax striatellus]|uniref:SH3 domain-containing protein n=1 Tax=Laodelphax striatellus TaxID=195883 RepID=A0A482XEC0_LAOST|nr:hypothetical protein LSTR_LSTR003786 [Laodelphax striatellus]
MLGGYGRWKGRKHRLACLESAICEEERRLPGVDHVRESLRQQEDDIVEKVQEKWKVGGDGSSSGRGGKVGLGSVATDAAGTERTGLAVEKSQLGDSTCREFRDSSLDYKSPVEGEAITPISVYGGGSLTLATIKREQLLLDAVEGRRINLSPLFDRAGASHPSPPPSPSGRKHTIYDILWKSKVESSEPDFVSALWTLEARRRSLPSNIEGPGPAKKGHNISKTVPTNCSNTLRSRREKLAVNWLLALSNNVTCTRLSVHVSPPKLALQKPANINNYGSVVSRFQNIQDSPYFHSLLFIPDPVWAWSGKVDLGMTWDGGPSRHETCLPDSLPSSRLRSGGIGGINTKSIRIWAELSPRIRVLQPLTPTTPPGPAPSTPPPLTHHHRLAPATTLTTSQSQPIYVPGKYSPSSCLSDKEEDEIYGFAGYGVYGKHMLQRQQQQAKLVIAPRHNYQNCLSPRSAYFYEFPPNERPGKKKTSFSRFLRHLKTHRKDKSISPRHPSSRVGTPEALDPPTVLPPMDYDRLMFLQKAPGSGANFEETIHRLKVQEALKKKEKFDREHEEEILLHKKQILRDIRQGLLQLSRGVSDDTYMYDDEMQRLGQHWYDEPPYESDPEDFLMADTSNHSRVCFTLNVRNESRSGESGVISLRSAGDISLPHHQRRASAMMSNAPQTILPLMHMQARNNRESGDYATSDVQSVCSQMSSLSMETSRSEQLEPDMYHRIRAFNGVESAVSPGHSSDYAGQEELVTLHSSCGNTSLAHRVRGLKGDNSVGTMKKPQSSGHRNAALHHSSAESLPSGSSLQALVPPSSNHSSEDSTTPMDDSVRGPMLARARALVDYTPSPYDDDALKFKKGDIIEVLSMSKSGLWRGRIKVRDGRWREGQFKFINVELIPEVVRHKPRHRPHTMEQMLRTIQMEEHMSLFVLNGYEDLEAFSEIREKDLDYLGMTDPQHRAKILAAVQVLNEYESPDEGRSSTDDEAAARLRENAAANNLGGETPTANCTVSGSSIQLHAAANCSPSNTLADGFLPNIPAAHNRSNKNSIEMNVFNDKGTTEPITEKVGVVKYIATELNCEAGNPSQSRNCSNLSEKSSDSGVSSSSLSSTNHNIIRQKHQRRAANKPVLIESPTRCYFLNDRKD